MLGLRAKSFLKLINFFGAIEKEEVVSMGMMILALL